MTFFGLKLGQDLENRAAHHHQEIPGVTPSPPPAREQTICVKFIPGRLIILRRKKLLFIN